MQFRTNYPIYLQVADFVCDKILAGTWKNEEKIPSVKELSILMSLNPNTIIKALTYLQEKEILFTQRGVGYFLGDTALEKAMEFKRNQFVEEFLPEVFSKMEALNITMKELKKLLSEHRQNEEKK